MSTSLICSKFAVRLNTIRGKYDFTAPVYLTSALSFKQVLFNSSVPCFMPLFSTLVAQFVPLQRIKQNHAVTRQ